ncbi:hypothetical protein J2W28_000228 [Variovorax boronicumulans]|uniref:hypothetical protein n=1 Tax=Variovorax boronicumulans TaxID=436515 RepID=UPI0027814ED2|nr:hypothetical protein [Variovorax boronicumulans]MDP9990389.1 hypothetical protein [Variovorax boronicumulans]MDQ0001100.1 hypothetical protein [Variovorax boronicumulans]
MAAHRYWRANAFASYVGGSLELTEFHLLAAGVRVDGPATLAASDAPSVGAVASLRDASTATGAEWPAAVLGALALTWDFGAGGSADVDDIRLGAGADARKFLLGCVVQWSDDAVAWTTSKVVYSAAWPGARLMTQSAGGGAPYFRSSASSINLSSQATVSIVLPLNLLAGSLLLIGVNYRGAPTAEPAGWTRISTTGVTTLAGQFGAVYAKTATEADSGSTVTFSQTAANFLSAYMIELGSYNGTPVVDQSAVGKVDGFTSSPISVLTSAGLDRLAVVYGATTTAFTDSSATITLSPESSLEWLLRTAQATSNLRGGFFTRQLSVGGTTAGTITSAGSSSNTAFSWNAFLFVAGPGITQNRATRIRFSQLAGAATSAVAGLTYGAGRAPVVGRSRQDYLNGQFGRGVGRVRGFTLDYVNPLNKPYRCRVRLVREVDGLLIRELWSGADGGYDFQWLDELQSYTVIAYYLDHGKRAVVTDGLTLANGKVELMP